MNIDKEKLKQALKITPGEQPFQVFFVTELEVNKLIEGKIDKLFEDKRTPEEKQRDQDIIDEGIIT